ncbi:flagellar hook-length control protein FliK [Liquorilactobacillus hordei]|uniref:flagellar hook-length control protein FliK n=3 Tax=Liquorilactobacillus hordei TaxID=468911 RepID=UPI001CC05EA2|nr:flagellar hook-length control protein FliK [Liquorilactobacillus hordei]MBZ2405952.1 flagellar hook-length control protein FliK [Liquorilactobacillus hordei]
MDSTLINSRQSATTNIANVEKTSSYGAESNLTGSATHFISLLQQKLISKTTVDDTSESDSSGEDSTDAKESQDKQDASMDEQVEKDKLENRNDMLNSPTNEISVAQEEKAMNSMVQARNTIVSTKIESTVKTEPISNASSMDNEETTQNKVSLVDRLQSVTPEIGKLDGAESTLTTNSIENQTGDTKIRDIKNKPVFMGKIDETAVNTQDFGVGESSKKSTDTPNITSNISDEKPTTLDTTSMVGNLQRVIPEIGKLDSPESTLTTNPIELQIGDAKIQDIKSKSLFTLETSKTLLNKQEESNSTSTETKTFENITGIQIANLMVEKSNSTNENADFTIKVNDSTTVLQDKTATSIVKTLVSGESKQVTVQLEPGSLGKIEISLQSTANEVSLNFKLTSSHAKSLISGIATQLEQVLNNQIAADQTANDKVTTHQTPASILDGAQFSFGQHQFGQQANQNMTKSRLNEQYRNNKTGQDEVIAKKQDNEQRNEKNIISILA